MPEAELTPEAGCGLEAPVAVMGAAFAAEGTNLDDVGAAFGWEGTDCTFGERA